MAELVDRVRENKARRWARRLDLKLARSRVRQLHINNHGLYRLTDATNAVFAGLDWELSLDDVERELAAAERKIAAARQLKAILDR